MNLAPTHRWRSTYPGAVVGVLVMEGVANPRRNPLLEAHQAALAEELRTVYAGQDRAALRSLPVIEAYNRYYRGFKKSYHILLQLESFLNVERPLAPMAALVGAVFLAELEDLLLTAVHDLDLLQPPLALDVAQGEEHYTRLNGQEQQLKVGDMFIADAQGVISSVIYGPDRRTCLSPATRRALFTTYAPPGIGEGVVRRHLDTLKRNVALITPQATVSTETVHLAI